MRNRMLLIISTPMRNLRTLIPLILRSPFISRGEASTVLRGLDGQNFGFNQVLGKGILGISE
ncbi:hypothetical protein QJS04_geneDACA006914 [Acorus gramineus]|uniref:Uncharacterized protein n=1 Tax=Acorus gramineus TaxID=55184 RepID=A0AAV9AY57_ACOGR|nr:hypothetical protein QJS04_geneDACA006914 [Acorus gramineus]